MHSQRPSGARTPGPATSEHPAPDRGRSSPQVRPRKARELPRQRLRHAGSAGSERFRRSWPLARLPGLASTSRPGSTWVFGLCPRRPCLALQNRTRANHLSHRAARGNDPMATNRTTPPPGQRQWQAGLGGLALVARTAPDSDRLRRPPHRQRSLLVSLGPVRAPGEEKRATAHRATSAQRGHRRCPCRTSPRWSA